MAWKLTVLSFLPCPCPCHCCIWKHWYQHEVTRPIMTVMFGLEPLRDTSSVLASWINSLFKKVGFSSIRQCSTILFKYIKIIRKYVDSLCTYRHRASHKPPLTDQNYNRLPEIYFVCSFCNYIRWRSNSTLIFQDIRSKELMLGNCHSYTTFHILSFAEIKGGNCLHKLLTLSNVTFLSSL